MSGREVFSLGLACSEDKRSLFSTLAKHFDQAGYRLEDGRLLRLDVHFYDSETIIRNAVGRDFPLVCPESTLDLYDLETRWEERNPNTGPAIAESCSFAVTPLVLLVQPALARSLGYPKRRLGWRTLQRVAETTDFRIMHAHGLTAHGRLVTVAQFIAGREKERVGREVYDESVVSFVRSLEAATREYGPSDRDVIARALGQGQWLAGLIVAQESNILSMLSELPPFEAVLVYPEEGTIWADHPLALMNCWAETNQREAFDCLRQHLSSPTAERLILEAGFHSTRSEDLGRVDEVQRFYQIQSHASQLLNVVTYGAPPMILPGIQVAGTIGGHWKDVEKPADVCLVIDVSGSMANADKLPRVQSGIHDFLELFQDSDLAVGLIAFNSQAQKLVRLQSLRVSRRSIEDAVSRLDADGYTALFDAVLGAVDELDVFGDSRHIPAIIALTDGQENSSRAQLSTVLQALQAHKDLVFYGIAYGEDAEREPLEQMATVTQGLVVDSSPSGIQQLFQEMARRV
jgi:Ca-activated chloride channel homolog